MERFDWKTLGVTIPWATCFRLVGWPPTKGTSMGLRPHGNESVAAIILGYVPDR
jgi:hypothetical protein